MTDPFDLSGKSAIVTGSSRGIGKAIAEQLALRGANVVISSRTQDTCEEVADAIEDLARTRAKQLFQAEAANVQPHSGTTANLSALMALAGANGRIVGMSLKDGGHLSHGHPASAQEAIMSLDKLVRCETTRHRRT